MKRLKTYLLNPETISGKYIFFIAVIFAAALILISVLFRLTSLNNEKLTRQAFLNSAESSLIISAESLSVSLKNGSEYNLKKLKSRISALVKQSSPVLSAVVYRRTADENYFHIVYSAENDSGLKIPLHAGAALREKKSYDFLSKGLTRPAVDSEIYSDGAIFWQNIYIPVRVDKRDHVIQFFIESREAVSLFSKQKRLSRKYSVMTALAVLIISAALAAAAAWFYYNFSQLIYRLSLSIKKAASGDYEVSLNENSADPALAELASSFNELVEEFKEARTRTEPAAQLPEIGVQVDTKDLFALGVSMLKEGRFEDSITVFKTINAVKPEAFANIFNMGIAYARAGMHPEALESFTEALRIDPSHLQASQYIEKIKSINNNEPG